MRRYLALCLLPFLVSCAASRPPIPPGEVPQARPVTVEDEQYGHEVFQGLTDRYEQDYNHPRAIEVQNIVERLTNAVGAGKDPWHVYIFKDASVKNAAATRGNHVFIWSGLLDSTKNEDELAVILAHEIGHVLAGHTDPDPNEEVKKLLINIGALAAGIAVTYATNGSYSGDLGNITSSVTEQLANSLLVYPYDQDNELEADQVGLFLMARAKYNPQAAIDFWDRAQSDPELSGNLGFLSTHPPASERVERLRGLLPQAMLQYNGFIPPPPTVNKAPANTSPFDPVVDTFDINAAKPPTSIVPAVDVPAPPVSGAAPSGSGSDWIVTAEKAVVYQRPSTSGKALGELRRGARVQVVESKGVWLKIVQPEIGYVKKALLLADQRDGGANSPGAVVPSVP